MKIHLRAVFRLYALMPCCLRQRYCPLSKATEPVPAKGQIPETADALGDVLALKNKSVLM